MEVFEEKKFMATAAETRCQRCGTKLRHNRVICPSCGLDLNTGAEPPQAEAPAEPAPSAQRRKVAAKAGVKICPVCMSSVPEEQIVELDGQNICGTCAENIKAKAAKKAAAPPPPPPDKK